MATLSVIMLSVIRITLSVGKFFYTRCITLGVIFITLSVITLSVAIYTKLDLLLVAAENGH